MSGLAPSPRSHLVGARAPVPYGVGNTVSDILMVNPANVVDVFSLYVRKVVIYSKCHGNGPGVSELWRVENRPLPLTKPMAYTTASTTVQAVIHI